MKIDTSNFNTADRRGNHVLSQIAVLERSADKSSNLCGEREGNHQMINDNDAPLKNRSFRFLRGSQWRVRESDRWRVVRPRTHTRRPVRMVGEGAKGNGLRGYSLTPFVRCKYKSVSCSPSAVTTSHSYMMRP